MAERVYRFGPCLLDSHNDQVRVVSGQEEHDVGLTGAEFQILVFLASRRGQLVTYRDLGEQMWPGEFDKLDQAILINRIHAHMHNLRGKLIDDWSDIDKDITSVRGRGYRVASDVVYDKKPSRIGSRTPVFVAILIVCVLVIAIAIVWSTKKRHSAVDRANTQIPAQLTTWSGLTLFPAISPDGSRVAYSSDHTGRFEIYVEQLTQGAPENQVTNDGGQNLQPTWSPDGQRIAYHSKERGGIWEIPAMGGKPTQLASFGSCPAWSPDGTSIAFQSNGLADLGISARNALSPSILYVVPALGGDPKPITELGNPSGGHGCPSWAPNGRRIAFEVDQLDKSSVWSVSVNGGDACQISPDRGYDPRYASDGASIYFTLGGLRQVRIDSDSGKPIGSPILIEGTVPAGPTELRYPSISPDGKKIAYCGLSQNSNLYSISLVSDKPSKPKQLTDSDGSRSSFPVYSPDGRKLAYDSGRIGAGVDIWIVNADGTDPIQVVTHQAPSDRFSSAIDHYPSWFPAMNELAFLSLRDGARKIQAVNVASGLQRTLLDLYPDVDYFRLSPDGSQIVFNRKQDGITNIWSMTVDGDPPKQLTFDPEMAGFPSWSPDGKYLALEVKRKDDAHICFMPSEGGEPKQLTFDRGQSWPHSWSPDGDRIAFAAFRNGFWNLWWVSRSSQKQRQLTDYRNLNCYVRYPSWSPLGTEIAYEYAVTKSNIWVLYR